MIGIENLHRVLNRLIWDVHLDSAPRWKAVPLRSARICYAVIRDLVRRLNKPPIDDCLKKWDLIRS